MVGGLKGVLKEQQDGAWERTSGSPAATAIHRKMPPSLYEKLEDAVIPMFYSDRTRFIDVMLHSIAINGSFFNTQRMVLQYVLKAYFI